MKKLKERFEDDPYFAMVVTGGAVILLTRLVSASAKAIEASAYAYRASKM